MDVFSPVISFRAFIRSFSNWILWSGILNNEKGYLLVDIYIIFSSDQPIIQCYVYYQLSLLFTIKWHSDQYKMSTLPCILHSAASWEPIRMYNAQVEGMLASVHVVVDKKGNGGWCPQYRALWDSEKFIGFVNFFWISQSSMLWWGVQYRVLWDEVSFLLWCSVSLNFADG